jgi:hypothetical protein
MFPRKGRQHHKEIEDRFMYRRSAEDARDPEDRKIDEGNLVEKKDKMMDKTVADTFPASDPPSSIPDPDEDSFAARNPAREAYVSVYSSDGRSLTPALPT